MSMLWVSDPWLSAQGGYYDYRWNSTAAMTSTTHVGYCGDGYNGTCVGPMTTIGLCLRRPTVSLIKFKVLSAIVV